MSQFRTASDLRNEQIVTLLFSEKRTSCVKYNNGICRDSDVAVSENMPRQSAFTNFAVALVITHSNCE